MAGATKPLERFREGVGRKQLPDMAPEFCSSSRRSEGRIAGPMYRSCNTEDGRKDEPDREVVF
jgi:hypothetical protein